MSRSPVRVKVTVRLAVLQLFVVDLVVSPVRVPSGCGCRVNTTQTSAGALLHCVEPRPTATQLPPISSNTKFETRTIPLPPVYDAVATQPPAPHVDRTAHVAVIGGAPAAGLPSRSVPGP